jgi:PAS domain S-box-containing protein
MRGDMDGPAWPGVRHNALRQRLSLPNPSILASLLLAFGLCGLIGWFLLEARRDAWAHAGREVANMRRLVARDLARNLELFDLSLRAVSENFLVPGVAELPEQIRQLALFDRAISASHVGAAVATDATGEVMLASIPGLAFNLADRDYFQVHRDDPDVGLFISRPQQGLEAPVWSLMLSRRRNNPDGSFAGVVVAAIQLTYLREMFGGLALSPGDLLAVGRTDGLLLMRVPFREAQLGQDLSQSPVTQKAIAGREETFVDVSPIDGVQRLYAAGRVGTLPLFVLVGRAIDQIEASWRREGLIEGLATLLMASMLVGLTLIWRRTLQRQKAAEAMARTNEASFRMLAENSGDMVTRLDLNLTRLYASPAARRIMRRPPEEIVGQNKLQNIHPDDRAGVQAAMARLREGAAEEARVTYRTLRPGPPDEDAWMEGTVRLTREPATGKPDGYVIVVRDITERRRQELEREARAQELAEARDAAEAASRTKSRFLSAMSHELRTPLNVILGFAQVLSLDEGLRESQRQQVAAMQAAGRHLLDMISDILDFSRIEAGQLELRPAATPLAALLEGCLDLIRREAMTKGLTLGLTLAPGAPQTATLDPLRLRQILLNLLGNAVKFTHQGGVTLCLAPAEPGWLRIEVADTGPGIPRDQRSRLFSEFARLGAKEGSKIEGSGLGLAISARLVALMGGRIGYAENPGSGSLFWLELPIRTV